MKCLQGQRESAQSLCRSHEGSTQSYQEDLIADELEAKAMIVLGHNNSVAGVRGEGEIERGMRLTSFTLTVTMSVLLDLSSLMASL